MHYLITKRLVLRTWQHEDVLSLAAINQDPLVMRYFLHTMDMEETEQLMLRISQHFSQHGYGLYAVVLKETQELIGYTGIYHPQFKAHFMPCTSIGWRFSSQHWNKGYATEAANAVLNEAFDDFHIQEVVGFCPIINYPSRRVMEKLGMQYNPSDVFLHPEFTHKAELRIHGLYRVRARK